MPFFPAAAGEFSPLWRMLDDYATPRTSHCNTKQLSKHKSICTPSTTSFYQPRFDVKEYSDHFELNGELPGVAQADVDIEFTDPQTLKISGHSARNTDSENVNESSAAVPAPQTDAAVSHKATVEDEQSANETVSEGEDWTPVPKPSSTPAPDAVAATDSQQHESASKPTKPRYWLSERAVGRFQRTFTFPSDRVDTENVKASLRDGILRVVVPRAPEPAKVKISIQ